MTKSKKKGGMNEHSLDESSFDMVGNLSKTNTNQKKILSEATIQNKIVKEVDIDKIILDQSQPRKFDEESDNIEELANSIDKNGLINFITVKQKNEEYIIIAGERRYRAVKKLGKKTIPVIIDNIHNEEDLSLIQITENLHRLDLTAVEEAEAYQKLQDEFEMQQADIVQKTGKSKSHISKMFKINQIDEKIRNIIRKKSIPKEVLFDLGDCSFEDQRMLWEEIKKTPTINKFKRAKKALENSKKEQIEDDELNPELVLEALQKIFDEEPDNIFKYISKPKAKKLLKKFHKK